MSKPSVSASPTLQILDVVPLCGPKAERWLHAFLGSEYERLANDTFEAIQRFRRHDHTAGRALLEGVEHTLQTHQGDAPAAAHIVRRWHLSARAYYHYLCNDLEAAEQDLNDAERELGAAITLHAFLLPLIEHCVDFRIQRARIARRRHQWPDVRRHIGIVRSLFADERPFLQLPNGIELFLHDLRAFYQRLSLSDSQRDDMRSILDDTYPHDRELDRLEESIFALPDFVIPYP